MKEHAQDIAGTSPVATQKTTPADLQVCVLASGSKGNAVYVSDGSTRLLVDAGLSGIEIQRRLETHQLNGPSLDAIVVSHEHSDHIRGVGILARRFNLPVYLTRATHQAAQSQLGAIETLRYIESGNDFQIKTLCIHPFATSHDAADSIGFTITGNGAKVGIATDLGIATGVIKQHLKGSDILVIEANHDPVMLEYGPYPWPLKQRIKSRSGHLANADTQNLLHELQHDKLKHIILAHLSETNNTPEKALETVKPALTRCKPEIHVALQDTCTQVYRAR